MDERRRFSKRERSVLFDIADGCCMECGDPLEPGWHADHDMPYSRAGETDVINGRALCPPCNLKKGNRVHYSDTFKARPFQREVINSVLDGMASGRDTTIVMASPGSGKTLAYQAAATFAYREGLADLVAVFVPRIILAQQCETGWMARLEDGNMVGNHQLFDSRSRLGKIRHASSRPPITPLGQTGIGFVATYSALVTDTVPFRSWAEHNKGRFLLVADEAQFCGASNDERSGGTRSGALITEMHEHAAHTLLLTGTPYRSDNQPLILAEYDEPDEQGKMRLLTSVPPADYTAGVAEGYLRRFEATMHDARVRWRDMAGGAIEWDLSMSSAELRDVLRKPEVWQPIVDGVVAAVREKQRTNPAYRGLISCMEMKDAGQVHAYLTSSRHAGLRVMKATSEDGEGAERDLREFREAVKDVDILVTVRKAFIGYDCPQITVVGILTHYRDWGHLEQLVGRGLRTWDGEPMRSQSCRVIAPDDPEMTKFIEYMQGASENGLRERARKIECGERERGKEPEELGYVESAYATTARVVSNDTELDNEQRLLIESVKEEVGACEDVTVLARFAEKLGLALPRTAHEPVAAPVGMALTEREQVDAINLRTAEAVKGILSAQGIFASRSDYGEHVQRVTGQVNKNSLRAPECRTVEQAQSRLNAALQMMERVS